MLEAVPTEALGPLLVAVGGIVTVLIQRGRRETTERFDRIERQLGELVGTVAAIDKRQDQAEVERAVIRNDVETIKERHHLMDMLRRDGRHRAGRRAGLWILAALAPIGAVMRWG